MPELPEVESVVRRLRQTLPGLKIRSVQAHRCATAAVSELAPQRTIQSVDRRAKHILIRLSGGLTLHTHLRMTGNLYTIADARLHTTRARVIFRLSDGSGLIYEDSRALGRMSIFRTDELNAKLESELGPEPLGPQFNQAVFLEMARRSRQPVKLFLMDQRRIAGLGNIYAAEALHLARIDPRKPISKLRPQRLKTLHSAIVSILRDAVESAWNAYSGPAVWAEGETFESQVYGREGQPCPACGKPIRRIPQGGRSTYFCPNCQR